MFLVGVGGACHTVMDGYYVECRVCFVVGMAWLLLWGHRTINRLTEAPYSDWRVVNASPDKRK